MNAGRVAHASVVQNFIATRGAAFQSVFDIERKNRRKLFHRQREVATNSADLGHQTTRARWHADARHAGNLLD